MHADLLAIESPAAGWRERFERMWSPGSDARASCGAGLAEGPDHTPAQALQTWDGDGA